jgi:hypothetical protein
MSGLGDILELMHSAHGRSKSVRAVYSEWTDQDRWAEAARRWAELHSSGSVHILGSDRVGGGPAVDEHMHRVWWTPGPRWRVESQPGHDRDADITILDGPLWWTLAEPRSTGSRDLPGWAPFAYTAGEYITNVAPDGNVDLRIAGSVPHRFIELMLDPASLLSSTVFEVSGSSEHQGRPAMGAVARWRRGIDLLYIDWPYADEMRLSVDVEYGVLLRLEFFLDSEPFLRIEAREIAFNEMLPASLFEGPPPTPGQQRLPDPHTQAPHLPRRAGGEEPDTL